MSASTLARFGVPWPAEAPLDDTGPPAEPRAISPASVRRWHQGEGPAGRGPGDFADDIDWVAEEVPVAFEYNGVGHAVMMATPEALEDLAVGFTLSEGIALRAGEILDLEVHAEPQGLRLAMQVTAQRFMALKARRRNLAGRTGCGLCGVDTLEQAVRPLPPLPASADAVQIDPVRLSAALAALDDAQPLRHLTGATHAAAWMGGDGQLHLLREDVGRHNALDKVIGALHRGPLAPEGAAGAFAGAALLTSRASVEMVQKAVAAGIAVLVARSAPTALAVRRARELRLTLAGFARAGRLVVYAHAFRLGGGAGAAADATGDAVRDPARDATRDATGGQP